ncbi:MAG: hypothetical protein WC875_00910 [Candidatus Absconditabacterales bacterium]|jgi:hypothetical protein
MSNKNIKFMKAKKIIFFGSTLAMVEDYIDLLKREGFQAEFLKTDKALLACLSKESMNIDLIISELIIEGIGDHNTFFGRTTDLLDNCAAILADELEKIHFKGKLMIMTNWYKTPTFKEAKKDKRFVKILTQLNTLPSDLFEIIKEELG